MTVLAPPQAHDMRRIWRAVGGAGLFADLADLRDELTRRPYRVLVGVGGRDLVVVVSRPWRVGQDALGVQYIACPQRERAAAVAAIGPAALEHGFRTVLSPMVSDTDAVPFVVNGYARWQTVLLLSAGIAGRRSDPASAAPPPGVTLRPAMPADTDGVLAIDERSFDDFWRYGRADIEELAPRQMTWVAVDGNEQVVGYTMGTVAGRQGNLTRLAVSPGWRRRGVASALVAAAASEMRRGRAARVLLCTQADNSASQQLYARIGFTQVGPPLSIYARDS